MSLAKKVRVLVVDDSALVRKIVTDSLTSHPDIEVVGVASDPYIAKEKLLQLNPDVMTLDIEMPRMDGLTFLRLVMKHRPMPVIIMSSLTGNGSQVALEALEAGAVDVLGKPNGPYSVVEDGRLIDKVLAAANAKCRIRSEPRIVPPARPPVPPLVKASRRSFHPRGIVLLGASTGGTEALLQVMKELPEDFPPTAIVQHIPAHFSRAFAQRLNNLCAMEVKEAAPGDVLKQGLALVAPGGYHMILSWNGSNHVVELSEGPKLHHQRPAVDVMFHSAAKCGSAPYSIAGLLTGMGADGAAGMLQLKNSGCVTLAQNQETCVVFGMPKEAIKLGAVNEVLALEDIPKRLQNLVLQRLHRAQAATPKPVAG